MTTIMSQAVLINTLRDRCNRLSEDEYRAELAVRAAQDALTEARRRLRLAKRERAHAYDRLYEATSALEGDR